MRDRFRDHRHNLVTPRLPGIIEGYASFSLSVIRYSHGLL
jgi:hypothetical protein